MVMVNKQSLQTCICKLIFYNITKRQVKGGRVKITPTTSQGDRKTVKFFSYDNVDAMTQVIQCTKHNINM